MRQQPYNIKINGPINVVRMEGTLNNINKIIYIFMEHHVPYQFQSKCDDSSSIDIKKFFLDSFLDLNNTDHTYDFFLEIWPEEIAKEQIIFNEKNNQMNYLDSVRNFFHEYIKYDTNKNKINSLFHNVRLHYIDIRLIPQYFLTTPLNYLSSIIKIVNNGESNDYYALIVDCVSTAVFITGISFLERIIDMLITKKVTIQKKQIIKKINYGTTFAHFLINQDNVQNNYIEIFMYSLSKLLHSYNHERIKNIIWGIIDVSLIPQLKKYLDDIQTVHRNTKNFKPEKYREKYFVNYFLDKLDNLDDEIFGILCRLMDIYFLRRFLDKDYITNAITYTGASHSVFFISSLLNLGFKITHVANRQDDNFGHNDKYIDKLHANILDVGLEIGERETYKLMELFFNVENPKQCSDLTYFPKKFS